MGAMGETWNCPHCGERILRSAASCPACQRRLRIDAVRRPRSNRNTVCPLSVDGIIRNPGSGGAWEYSVLVEVHDSRGEKLVRRIVGVGKIPSGETRTFTIRVEMEVPGNSPHADVSSPSSIDESDIRDAGPRPPATGDRHA